MAQAFLRSENLFMRIQYELLKTTSKRTCESYIRNSRQIKNSWKISPYIPPTLKNFDVLVEENWTKRYLGHWPKITTISSHDRVSGWGQSFLPHPPLFPPPPPLQSVLLITCGRRVMCHSALLIQCERTSKPFPHLLPFALSSCSFIWPFR